MSSLKNKASRINLDLDADASLPGDLPSEPARPLPSGGRSGVAAITNSINAQHRIQDLEEEVATLKAASVVLKLDPKLVQQSRWKNRDELSYLTPAYADLKKEIAEAGGNVQPIKVRRVAGAVATEVQRFEIVYGRRRLRACLELGLPVSAIVEDMNDMHLFLEMERENRSREDLSPWEQGVMYKDALDAGLFPSLRKLAEALGVNLALVSQSVRLASLPAEVIEAFPSPLDIQFRWTQPLVEALEKDPLKVTSVAQQLATLSIRPSAKDVLSRLVGAASPEGSVSLTRTELKSGGKLVGSIERNKKGAVTVRIAAGALDESAFKQLSKHIETLVERHK